MAQKAVKTCKEEESKIKNNLFLKQTLQLLRLHSSLNNLKIGLFESSKFSFKMIFRSMEFQKTQAKCSQVNLVNNRSSCHWWQLALDTRPSRKGLSRYSQGYNEQLCEKAIDVWSHLALDCFASVKVQNSRLQFLQFSFEKNIIVKETFYVQKVRSRSLKATTAVRRNDEYLTGLIRQVHKLAQILRDNRRARIKI